MMPCSHLLEVRIGCSKSFKAGAMILERCDYSTAAAVIGCGSFVQKLSHKKKLGGSQPAGRRARVFREGMR